MKIKICGLTRPQDIMTLNEYQPDYAGFVINFPKSRRSVSPQRVYELTEQLLPSIPVVGVTMEQPLRLVSDLLNDGILDIAQLHGNEDENYIRTLQEQTGKPVWKAFRIRSQEDLDRAATSCADLVLLDNGYGTGEVFDWTLIRDIGRPFALAGGLNAENIRDAARRNPYLLDVSSGAESGGIKDPKKIKEIVEIVRRIP